MNRLDEIEARANAATEGPWEWEGKSDEAWPQGDNSLIAQGDTEREVIGSWGHDAWGVDVENPADAEFIAHARADVPALVAALRGVLGLHQPTSAAPLNPEVIWCRECAEDWTCPTVAAIRQHLGEDV